MGFFVGLLRAGAQHGQGGRKDCPFHSERGGDGMLIGMYVCTKLMLMI